MGFNSAFKGLTVNECSDVCKGRVLDRKSGVHNSELSSQECAYSSSLTEGKDGCLLSCTSDRINRQLY
jgi:hypothetical protein